MPKHKSLKRSAHNQCPPGHGLVIGKHGEITCSSEQIKKIREQLTKDQKEFESKDLYRTYDISDLVSPYPVNPAHRRQLQYLFGKDDVSKMEMINTLVYSG